MEAAAVGVATEVGAATVAGVEVDTAADAIVTMTAAGVPLCIPVSVYFD